MKQKPVFWKNLSRCMRVFLILSLVFLAVGLGTLGSVHGVGASYRLPVKREGDGKRPAVTVHLTEPGHGDADHEHKDLYIKAVYVNAGTIYNDYGKTAKLVIARGVSSSNDFYLSENVTYANLYLEEGSAAEGVTYGGLFNWVSVHVPDGGWRLATYPYFQFRAEGADILLNEAVFVAAEKPASDSNEFIGEDILLEAEVFASASNLPRREGETEEEAVEKASAIVDSRHLPSLSQSSYFRFGSEEAEVLSAIAEMRQDVYLPDNVYHLSTAYNSLGIDLSALGTAIFGTSPFGLRFMPFLASFGALIFGALLARDLLKSDKAAMIFAIVYLLAGIPMSLGHFGAPAMIGVFFTVASLYFCRKFFEEGMREAKFSAAVPVLLSAFFAALAICVSGAFLIPVIGICGLFAAGVVRQSRKSRATLDSAIEEAERIENETEKRAGMQRVADLVNESRFKKTAAVCVFPAVLLLGALLCGVLSALPLYSVYGKVYGGGNIFAHLWKSFAGGFLPSASAPGVYNLFYPLFKGEGSLYAVTSAGPVVAILPIVLGIVGLICALTAIAKDKEKGRDALACTLILLIGFALSVVTALFAGAGVAMLFLAYLFLFLFATRLILNLLGGAEQTSEENGTAVKTHKKLVIALLVAGIVLFAAFSVLVFSIPLPASLMNAIFSKF